jgi:hypothetical protein
MNIDELKGTWERQKDYSARREILEDEIVFLIRQDMDGRMKVRKLLYNTSSFFFLLVVCQTC